MTNGPGGGARKGPAASRRQPINLSGVEAVREEPLGGGEFSPLMLTPGLRHVDLAAWAGAHRAHLEERLLRHGALLFRGFRVPTAEEFERVAAAACPSLFGEYGDLPRQGVGGRIYGSTPYPADQPILFHNESSHQHRWPMRIFFYCVRAAARGGETPVVDCRQVLRRLDPALRERFAARGLMYVRNYTDGLDVSWQDFFRAGDRREVEEFCRGAGVEFEWKPGGGLRTRQLAPALLRHPRTGEEVFFNQIQLHHVSCLAPAAYDSLRALFAVEDFPRNVYYGDGEPIADSTVGEIVEAYRAAAFSFPWREGDVLLLDNMLVAHGRNPFEGPRKIVVAMGDMFQPGSEGPRRGAA